MYFHYVSKTFSLKSVISCLLDGARDLIFNNSAFSQYISFFLILQAFLYAVHLIDYFFTVWNKFNKCSFLRRWFVFAILNIISLTFRIMLSPFQLSPLEVTCLSESCRYLPIRRLFSIVWGLYQAIKSEDGFYIF